MADPKSSLEDTAFQTAVDEFKANCELNQRELEDLEITTLEDLQKVIIRIQNKQKASKKIIHLKRLQPFLHAMEQYGEVVGVFVNTCDLLAYIWGPIKFLLLAVNNFNVALNALLDGYNKIGRSIPILVHYRVVLDSDPILQDALVPIFEHILEFHSEAVRIFRQKTWKTVFEAAWKRIDKKIVQLSSNLDQQKQFFESTLSFSQYKEVHELRKDLQHGLQQLEEQRLQSREEFDRRDQEETDRRRRRAHEWLGEFDCRVKHQHAIEKLYPGTGQWLLKVSKFQNWFPLNRCSDPLLWISGQPGAGKTTLSSFIIEEIKRIQSVTVAFFYCKHEDDRRMRVLAVMRGILSQILEQNEDLLPIIYGKAAKSGQVNLSDLKLAKELLEIALKAKKNTYIIIDGLDEYERDERKDIIQWFQQSVKSIPTNELGALRCLFVSQEDGPAKKDLSMLSHIKITSVDNTADIRSYVQQEYREIAKKFGLEEEHNTILTRTITDRAEGMFLYAYLVLQNLLEQPSRYDLYREMDPDVLPNGYERAYGRVIERLTNRETVSRSRRKHINRLLEWLACAKRPMKWHEIQAAISLDVDQGRCDVDRRSVEDSRDLCASLIKTCSDGTITLVHHTAREFLTQKRHIQIAQTNLKLAEHCLTYLTLPDFGLDASEDQIKSSIIKGNHAFLDYALSYWGSHIETGLSRAVTDNQQDPDTRYLSHSLDYFFKRYWIADESLEMLTISDKMRENLSPLEGLENEGKVLQCISAMKSALRLKGQATPLEDMLSVYKVLRESRQVLEAMVSQPQEDQKKLQELYGPKWFKCSRLNCRFFYVGFATEALRQQHLDRHDRSYLCDIEGCLQGINGCATAKDLEKHISEFHGIDIEDDKDEFPPPEKYSIPEDRRGKYRCEKCPNRYRTETGLQKHRQNQCDLRQRLCAMCGKGFRREQEKKRHEISHNGEKKYSCPGPCGKRFRRMDALHKHHRTTAGRACLKSSSAVNDSAGNT